MTMTQIDPQEMAQRTADFFMQAAHDQRLGERLALAGTTVHIHYTDDVGVTLNLDKSPISAEPRIIGNAEVELWGSPELFVAFVRREKQMAMAINNGELEYRGPVRKFLRIVPILRSFDFGVWRGTTSDEAPAS
jgi:hypothetical protein